MAQNIFKDQSELSHRLQLLCQLGYCDLEMPYQGVGEHSNKNSRDDETNTTIRILDTIAVALTTGKPGEVYAVGLDKAGGLKLVLAKNEPHTDEDDQAVLRLLSILTDPETDTAVKVLPFLLAHCEQNIKKRVRKMVEALNEFSGDFFEAVAPHKPSSPFSQEFPASGTYRSRKYPNGEPEFPQMMRNLWTDISAQAHAFLGIAEGAGSTLQVKSFGWLALTVAILKKSPFLGSLCDPNARKYPSRKAQAEKLRRRLSKVCQYFQGIDKTVKYMKRVPARSITHYWVNPTITTGKMKVELDHYLSVMSRVVHPRLLPTDTEEKVKQRFPQFEDNWRRNSSLRTHLHPEISILLHFHDSSNPPNHKFDRQPIGCSKRTCLCCTLWINAYNESFCTGWLTSGSNGKPYVTWALPSHFYPTTSVVNLRNKPDAAVMHGVAVRLANSLEWLMEGERGVSDEYWPSGSGSGGSEAVEEKELERLVYELDEV